MFNQYPYFRHSIIKPHHDAAIFQSRCLDIKVSMLLGTNRLKLALRNAAFSISKLKDSPLYKFYKKIAFKKGGIKAITATARKLAVIIWNMLTKKIPYQAREQYLFLDQKRKQIVSMRKKIAKFGIDAKNWGYFQDQNMK